jgi:hypothetical protein
MFNPQHVCVVFVWHDVIFAQPLPDPSSVSSEVFRRLEREQAALKIQVTPPFSIFVLIRSRRLVFSAHVLRSDRTTAATLGWAGTV